MRQQVRPVIMRHIAAKRMPVFGFKGRYGLSFSWRRLLGIAGLRSSVARRTGVPTTLGGLERKIGRYLQRLLFGQR